MDHALFDILAENSPKFNPAIVNGLATIHVAQVEAYLDRYIRTMASELPPDLKYHGIVRCTPEEEYQEIMKRMMNTSISTIEHAASTTYAVKLMFSFQGEYINPPVIIQLPYVLPGGLMRIHGSLYSICPVMVDNVISVLDNSIFVYIVRAKLIFTTLNQAIMVDDQREVAYVHRTKAHNLNAKMKEDAKKRTVKGSTTLPHYLFGKFGLKETFRLYTRTEIVIGRYDELRARLDPNEYVVISSTTRGGINKPRDVKEKPYKGSDFAVGVKRSDYTMTVTSLLSGLFYVADRFPDRVIPENIDETTTEEETNMWKVLIGLLLFGAPEGEGKVLDNMEAHYRTLDNYLDVEVRKDLASVGANCNHIYDLFFYIIENYSLLVVAQSRQLSSMYDKHLVLLRYLMADIIFGINRFMYRFTSISTNRRPITLKDITNAVRENFKTDTILNQAHSHTEMDPVSTPSDNMYFEITCRVAQQSDMGREKKTALDTRDPTKLLHVSLAEVGSYNTVSKSDPTGRSRLNPHLRIGSDGSIVRDPGYAEILDNVQRSISS